MTRYFKKDNVIQRATDDKTALILTQKGYTEITDTISGTKANTEATEDTANTANTEATEDTEETATKTTTKTKASK